MKFTYEKMVKDSLKTFKKYNAFLWEKKYLLKLKPGDIVAGCDGFNHKIKEAFFERIPYKKAYYIELSFTFEDGHDFNYYCTLQKPFTLDEVKEMQINDCIYKMNLYKDLGVPDCMYSKAKKTYEAIMSGEKIWDEFGCKLIG